MMTSNETYIPGLKVAPEMALCFGPGPGHGDGGPLIWREGNQSRTQWERIWPLHNWKGKDPGTLRVLGKVCVPSNQ